VYDPKRISNRSKEQPMSKHTASAAGGAMPADAPSLLNIADALDTTSDLIIAASNLAAGVDDTQSIGLHAVIRAAEDKLDSARAMLAAVRGQKAEGADL
jgi:hypothetical protein